MSDKIRCETSNFLLLLDMRRFTIDIVSFSRQIYLTRIFLFAVVSGRAALSKSGMEKEADLVEVRAACMNEARAM